MWSMKSAVLKQTSNLFSMKKEKHKRIKLVFAAFSYNCHKLNMQLENSESKCRSFIQSPNLIWQFQVQYLQIWVNTDVHELLIKCHDSQNHVCCYQLFGLFGEIEQTLPMISTLPIPPSTVISTKIAGQGYFFKILQAWGAI